MQNIKGKVIIITGASSGIGEATAYKLASAGAKLVLGARREDKLRAIADKINADGAPPMWSSPKTATRWWSWPKTALASWTPSF